jgi:hypothetical protein
MYKPLFVSDPEFRYISFRGIEKECVTIEIADHDYDVCEEVSKNFWANSKKGGYGKGLGRTNDDPYKPARTGLLGQMAFSKILCEPVDTMFRQYGDNYDNLIGGYKVDIKCAMRNYGECLIYHTNEWGTKIPLNKDIYVCCYIDNENRKEKKANIVIVGYILRKNVELCPVKVGRKGNGHLNYVVNFEVLSPIKKLINAKKKYFGFKNV